MFCLIDRIVTEDTQKLIDTGLQTFSEEMSKRVKPDQKKVKPSGKFDTCYSNMRNKAVLWMNLGIQFIVLIFLGVIAGSKGQKMWAFDMLKWISWVTLFLTVLQYKNGIMAGVKIFIFGTSVKTQFIMAISLAIVILSNLLQSKEGGVASLVSAVMIILIIARISVQIQTTLTNDSAVPVVLDFVNKVVTVDRVKTLKNALR
jgi:hypothetical protein